MAIAHAKKIRITARKVRLVCDLIRGKSILEAMQILEFTNKSSAPVIQKLIKSAAANAVNNNGKDINKLYIKEIYANEGTTLKRFRPRSQGRAFQILKRSSHITTVVEEK